MVVWQSAQDGSGTAIHAQRFDRDGQPIFFEFQVNLATGDQVTPDVKMSQRPDGHGVGGRPDGSGTGIFGRASTSSGTRLVWKSSRIR